MYVVIYTGDDGSTVVDWDFMTDVASSPMKLSQRKHLFQPNKKKFVFNTDDFNDAVVMPSYRNIDQPQYFYVAEIRHDLHPKVIYVAEIRHDLHPKVIYVAEIRHDLHPKVIYVAEIRHKLHPKVMCSIQHTSQST